MIKQLILTGTLACAAVADASAATHTYTFTAGIDSLYSGGYLPSTVGPDGVSILHLGDQIQGWFRFDDSAEPVFGHEDRDAIHVLYDSNAWGGLTIGGTDVGISGDGRTAWIDLTSNSPQWIDTMTVYMGAGYNGTLTFEDASGTVFVMGFPDGTLSLDRLSSAKVHYDWQGPDGKFVRMEGVLNSLAPVPEPETWGLLLAGLGVIGFAARRARG